MFTRRLLLLCCHYGIFGGGFPSFEGMLKGRCVMVRRVLFCNRAPAREVRQTAATLCFCWQNLKTLTSLNKESRPFFLGHNSIWSCPSLSYLSDYSIRRSWRLSYPCDHSVLEHPKILVSLREIKESSILVVIDSVSDSALSPFQRKKLANVKDMAAYVFHPGGNSKHYSSMLTNPSFRTSSVSSSTDSGQE